MQNKFDWLNLHVPILIWRVFSGDVVNIYSLVYEVDSNGDKRLINRWNFLTDYGENIVDRIRFFNVAGNDIGNKIQDVRWRKKHNLVPKLFASVIDEKNDFEVFDLRTRSTELRITPQEYFWVRSPIFGSGMTRVDLQRSKIRKN